VKYFGMPVPDCLPVSSSRHLAGILLFSAITVEYSWLSVVNLSDARMTKHLLFMAPLCLAKQIRPYHNYHGPGLTTMQSIDWAIWNHDY